MRLFLSRLVLLGYLVVVTKQTSWEDLARLTDEQISHFLQHPGDLNIDSAQAGASRAEEPSQFESLLSEQPTELPESLFTEHSTQYQERIRHLHEVLGLDEQPYHLGKLPVIPEPSRADVNPAFAQTGVSRAEPPPQHLERFPERFPNVPIITPQENYGTDTSFETIPIHSDATQDPLSEIFGGAARQDRAVMPADATSSTSGPFTASPPTADRSTAYLNHPLELAPITTPTALSLEERKFLLAKAVLSISFKFDTTMTLHPFLGHGLSHEFVSETYAARLRLRYLLAEDLVAVRHGERKPVYYSIAEGGMPGTKTEGSLRLYVWKIHSLSVRGSILQLLGSINTQAQTVNVMRKFPSAGRILPSQVFPLGADCVFDKTLVPVAHTPDTSIGSS